MKYRKLILTGILCVTTSLASSCWSRRGDIKEKWETTNQTFKIRVTTHEEKGGFPLSGRFYVFWSASVGSDDWHEIIAVLTDDPVPIPHKNIRFVNNQTGYVFMGQKYAVTTDGGGTWSVWDAKKDSANDAFIKEVQIRPDGIGVMTFHPIPSERREVLELHTKDYGRNWSIK